MAIQKITQAQRNLIKNASVHALSTRPGEQGKKEIDVKNAMYVPIEMLMDEIDNIIDRVEAAITTVDNKVIVLQNTTFESDSITTAIDHTLENNKAKAYTGTAASVNITIPSGISAGFCSEVSFKTGDTAPTVTFTNSSGKTFFKMQYGAVIGTYNAPKNAKVSMVFYCMDGESVEAIILDLKQ